MSTALVIGGTGSLGSKLVPMILGIDHERVRILSRGEHKQIEMARRMKDDRIDYLVGDVRDRDRVLMAIDGCDTVYHLAAMKSVDKAEYDPRECCLTNIVGTQNVIDACRYHGVERAITIGTDKLCSPLNYYGKTKAIAEHEWILSNCGKHNTKFFAARYGNVFGSNSSVLHLWRDGHIGLTDETMTRFFITQWDAARFVRTCMKICKGGEVAIPYMKATTVKRLMEIVTGMSKYELIGKRPGEKIHEVLITSEEAPYTTDVGWGYVRWPLAKLFPFVVQGTVLPDGFTLASDVAPKFTDDEIREMLEEWQRDLNV